MSEDFSREDAVEALSEFGMHGYHFLLVREGEAGRDFWTAAFDGVAGSSETSLTGCVSVRSVRDVAMMTTSWGSIILTSLR